MAQVLEFTLPDLGEGLTEAEIIRWLVAVGDVVAVDQPVVEVETAKAMVEVPCPYAGVVTARFGEEGTELPVGAPLLTVAVGAEAGSGSTSAEASGAGARGGAGGAAESEAGSGSGSGSGKEGSGNVLVGYGTGAAPARRRRVRPQPLGAGSGPGSGPAPGSGSGRGAARPGHGAGAQEPDRTHQSQSPPHSQPPSPSSPSLSPSPSPYAGREPQARIQYTDVLGGTGAVEASRAGAVGSVPPAREAEGPVPVISPLVRRLAREHGLDLWELTGSGVDGLILRADVEYAVRAAEQTAHKEREATPAAEAAGQVRTPLRGVRGAVADKLSRSRREIPDATCWVDADATELMNARAAMNAAAGAHGKISLLALLARICTAALARYPDLNSRVDLEAREVVRLDAVHLGFAAQTERGLVVPVVRDAHARDAESLSAEFARLTEEARAGALTPADLTGGTFTLNNYGVFGVDGSTPIINHPEAAMLGVGRIVPKPWVHQGELAVRQVVQLSLTFDHRVCDGGTAGGFLRYVADCVEQPAVLLRTL
ncbi:dihydrolipoamide acetyltransferase family protein [Streptomyces monticola]|uniref:Dihydrolipoamide acetyltransferase component of pyruvate dehydrogenase complex n=1 Tax=Streptomyces monticola TaxID=2666263 RepID=A0ABW2JKK2_9ACTN